MKQTPLRITEETRAYVRVAMRDTLAAYDLADLLDLMANICQENADGARNGGDMGLPCLAWDLRAEILRAAADRLNMEEPASPIP